MPPDNEQRPYEEARDKLSMAQGLTRDRLSFLRDQREGINAEIKLLVEEDELLSRMMRIATKAARR